MGASKNLARDLRICHSSWVLGLLNLGICLENGCGNETRDQLGIEPNEKANRKKELL